MFEQLVIGLANGGVYASLGLALVIVYRTTGVINFAQGELATFTSYVTWTLLVTLSLPFSIAIIGGLATAFVVGVVLQVALIRRTRQNDLAQVIVTLGLFMVFNNLDLSIWGGIQKSFPPLFGEGSVHVFGVNVGVAYIAVFTVTLLCAVLTLLFFRYTRLGIAMDACTLNEEAARLVGINVERMRAMGWGLAGLLGGVAAIMTANLLLLDPNMMTVSILFSFAAIALGGVSSPVGALIGGLFIGVLQTFIGTYVPGAGTLRTPLALVILVLVLVARPNGLFGRAKAVRA